MAVARERSLAAIAGERLVDERKLQLPIDPFEIARSEGITVLEKRVGAGVSGMFMRVGDEFAIAYAAHIDNEGFQRFSVAHELGHYFLEGHIEHVLKIGDVHESRAGFTSKAPHGDRGGSVCRRTAAAYGSVHHAGPERRRGTPSHRATLTFVQNVAYGHSNSLYGVHPRPGRDREYATKTQSNSVSCPTHSRK